MTKLTNNNTIAKLVGILFIIGTLAGILSVIITGQILTNADYLTEVTANENKIIIGGILILIMGFSLAMIPALLYPIFKKQNEALAIGAIIFRGALEAVMYIGIVICWGVLIKLSSEFVAAGSPDATYFQMLGILLQDAIVWLTLMVSFVFSIGALMIYYLFYTSKLIPNWLSIWGIVGGILYFVVPVAMMFGVQLDVLMAPLALQEMVLAVWLIVKGFQTEQ